MFVDRQYVFYNILVIKVIKLKLNPQWISGCKYS